MAHKDARIETDILGYLEAQEKKSLLRFITCGSVDDGKSTLIGRLLYESKLIYEDQLAALEADSKKVGTQGQDIDFALLVDGLAAEREQGITIDVAYRYFSTEKRKFIVADTPGHEQYTRNMATGASTASLAILMIDARKGVSTQTRRHSVVVDMLGVRRLVLAINKMDLVGYSKERFDKIVADYTTFAKEVGIATEMVTAIPMSALRGDNVVEPSQNMDWSHAPTLMAYLETVPIDEEGEDRPFRLPVQWVNRPNQDFRGFSGMIASGAIARGGKVRAAPSGKTSTIASILVGDQEAPRAVAGQSVVVTLEDEIDVSRGDVLCAANAPCQVADQFQAKILWMNQASMLSGRTYWLKLGASSALATLAAPKHKIDVDSLERKPTKTLDLNDIGVVNLALDRAIAFDPYDDNRDMGGFVLIDRLTNETVACGMIDFALRRSQNLHLQALDIDKKARAALKDQKPAVLWFTGLSGSGKSTIANALERKLHAMGRHTILLDGDNVRHGLNKDLGFTDADRAENIRRIAEVAKLMCDAGLIVLVSFISPFRSERRMARRLLKEGEFIEIHVDASLELAESRDPKGLYKKARRGEIKNFTGLDSPYEPPTSPEVHLDIQALSVAGAVDQITARLDL